MPAHGNTIRQKWISKSKTWLLFDSMSGARHRIAGLANNIAARYTEKHTEETGI
jgi:hypothetical protein